MLWFHCSFKVPYRQRFEICGTKKSLIVHDLVLPTHESNQTNQYTLQSSGLTKYDLLTYHDTRIVTKRCTTSKEDKDDNEEEDVPVVQVSCFGLYVPFALVCDFCTGRRLERFVTGDKERSDGCIHRIGL